MTYTFITQASDTYSVWTDWGFWVLLSVSLLNAVLMGVVNGWLLHRIVNGRDQ